MCREGQNRFDVGDRVLQQTAPARLAHAQGKGLPPVQLVHFTILQSPPSATYPLRQPCTGLGRFLLDDADEVQFHHLVQVRRARLSEFRRRCVTLVQLSISIEDLRPAPFIRTIQLPYSNTLLATSRADTGRQGRVFASSRKNPWPSPKEECAPPGWQARVGGR